jgi:hypothetical protein
MDIRDGVSRKGALPDGVEDHLAFEIGTKPANELRADLE